MIYKAVKLRCKKQFGIWYYQKITPDCYSELDAPIYNLYDEDGDFVAEFGSYGDMKYYVETGKIL